MKKERKIMKTKMFLVIASALLFAMLCIPQKEAASDTINPCWRLTHKDDPQHGSYNPDSVMFDSCLCPPNIPIYCKYIYAKKYFKMFLPYRALFIPELPWDTLVYRHWQDIDTNFINLRNGLDTLEKIFCSYEIQKEQPDNIDSTSWGSRSFYIIFDNYVNIDSVDNYLNTVKDIEEPFYWYRDGSIGGINWSSNNNKDFNYIINNSNYIIEIIIPQNRVSQKNKFNIYNYLGIKIFTGEITNANEFNIDISGFRCGLYFLQINDKIYKFIKM